MGILRRGNPSIDAAGDLVHIVSDGMNLPPKGFELFVLTDLGRIALNEADEIGPLAESTLLGIRRQ